MNGPGDFNSEEAIPYDVINHPPHYTKGIETTVYINSWDMGFVEGNIIKYVTRHKYKGNPLEDLKKAKWYLDYLIWMEGGDTLKAKDKE